MKIKSDRVMEYEHMEETMESMDMEPIPVDLYNKRTFPNKGNPANLENAAHDIKDVFGLNTLGPKGGE